ncbi:hypothetical protein D3C83_252390 [compost metagenome]
MAVPLVELEPNLFAGGSLYRDFSGIHCANGFAIWFVCSAWVNKLVATLEVVFDFDDRR